jgi:hypothetical protein
VIVSASSVDVATMVMCDCEIFFLKFNVCASYFPYIRDVAICVGFAVCFYELHFY